MTPTTSADRSAMLSLPGKYLTFSLGREAAGPVMMGIVVDEVSEVLNLTTSDIEPTPGFGAEMTTDYMLGIARVGDRLKILLDLDRVFGGAEISLCL